MQIVRTLVWALILFGLLAFSFFNWESVEVTLWDNLVLETKVPALVIISFLLGLLPMWAIHRGNSSLARHEPAPSASAVAAPTSAPAPAPTDAPSTDTLNPTKD